MPLLGLIGNPLEHSYSPSFFKKKFEEWGCTDYEYRAFPLESLNEVSRLIVEHTTLEGLNITIPYKESIIGILDEIDAEAEAIGAVNVVKIHRDERIWTKGFNTDAQGFTDAYQGILHPATYALILGSGGASKAVAYALNKLGINSARVGRDNRKGHITYSELTYRLVKEAQLIVQTTPLGTYPNVDRAPPFPVEYLDETHTIIDLIYNPPKTAFMESCAQRGATVFNGMAMLEAQALLSWKIWTEGQV